VKHAVWIISLTAIIFISCGKSSKPELKQSTRDVEANAVPELSEEQVGILAQQVGTYVDGHFSIASPKSVYAVRLAQLTRKLSSKETTKPDFKAYTSSRVDVLTLPNGNIRVFGGLFELLDDDELRFVVAQQIAHLKLGHSKRRLATAYASTDKGKMSSLTVLNAADLAALEKKLQNTAYAETEEEAADAEALTLLKAYSYPTSAAGRAFSKLLELRNDRPGLFSSKDELRTRIKKVQVGEETESKPAQELFSIGETPLKDSGELNNPLADIADGEGDKAEPSKEKEMAAVSAGEMTLASESGEMTPREVKTATLRTKPGSHFIKAAGPEAPRPSELGTRTGFIDETSSSLEQKTPKETAKAKKEKPDKKGSSTGSIKPVARGWYVQVAADTTELEAVSRQNFLKSTSFSTQIQPVDMEGVKYYRVLVGPYGTREIAQESLQKIKDYKVTNGLPFVREFK
jgi:metalloprotease